MIITEMIQRSNLLTGASWIGWSERREGISDNLHCAFYKSLILDVADVIISLSVIREGEEMLEEREPQDQMDRKETK